MEDLVQTLEKFGLQKSVVTLRKEVALTKQPTFDEEYLLGVIRKSLVNKEKKKLREETKLLEFKYKPQQIDHDKSFNKEETEAVMEKLMNRIVVNPKLINEDSELNQRIEKIFNLDAFQKMVENADIFQELSSSSIFSNSQVMHKSMMSQNMNQMLNPASLITSSAADDSVKYDNELLKKEHEDSLFKSDIEDAPKIDNKPEPVRGKGKVIKPRYEDKKKEEKSKEEKTHTTSHEEKVPMKNQEFKGDKEESKKISDHISKELKEHQSEHSPRSTVHDGVNEYENDEDQGFTVVEVPKEKFKEKCLSIAQEHGYPEKAFKPTSENELIQRKKTKLKKELEEQRKKNLKKDEDAEGEDEDIPSKLPKWVKFTPGDDEFYPAEFNSVVYDCYNLKVIFDREKTGFEETRDFQIIYNSIIAGRYQVMEYLGSAAFSKAIK